MAKKEKQAPIKEILKYTYRLRGMPGGALQDYPILATGLTLIEALAEARRVLAEGYIVKSPGGFTLMRMNRIWAERDI